MLPAGTRLGPYELESLIGTGGMGEVYRARDTRLQRTVAIKILSSDLGRDADFRSRVEREARAISQLNHPHICTLHDIGENYLVMELIQGETLSQVLERGPLPVARLLEYAAQMADALDKAHRQGIVHGDLKPGNIMVTRSGIKLLDFGLAVERHPRPVDGWSDTATQTAPVGTAGAVLGTLPYLAPEQLEGKLSDERTDLFACGAVIYEMATGRRAFDGASQATVIAAIMREAPRPLREVAPHAPAALDRLVSACLAKDPAERWQSAGDLRRELEWMAAASQGDDVHAPTPGRGRWVWGAGAAVIALVLGAAGALFLRPPAVPSSPTRSSILLPDGVRFPTATTAGGGVRVSVSPDGRQIAFVAVDANGNTQLWVRALDAIQSVPLRGTDGAASPFWSPDARTVAFVAQGQLKAVDAAGGTPVVIADQAINATGAWNDEGTILFTPTPTSPIHRVAAAGGTPEPVTTLDASEATHRSPVFLPGGRRFLYVATGAPRQGETTPPRSIHVGSLDGDASRPLVPDASSPQYADGYLLFARDGVMLVQTFDPETLVLSGQPRPLGEQVEFGGAGAASLGVSRTGTLVFQPAASGGSQLVWFDRGGRQVGTLGDPDQYADVELSPDGTRAAITVFDPAVNTRDIWVFDVARGVRSRLTSDRADDVAPIWSGDSSRVLFTSNRSGRFDLYQRDASGLGPESTVYADESDKYPTSWSADGAALLYWTFDPAGSTLALLDMTQEPAPRTFLGSPVSPGRFSPDKRWVAYYSAESGRSEIYVVPFPRASRKWQVSTRGGSFVRWRADGRELFYISRDNRLMAVEIDGSGATPQLGAERALFDARAVGPRYFYDVSPDGQRVLVNTTRDANATASIAIVQHWSAALDGE